MIGEKVTLTAIGSSIMLEVNGYDLKGRAPKGGTIQGSGGWGQPN